MDCIVRNLGMQPYQDIYHHMQDFTQSRHDETPDELWLVEHYPVFTQGLAGKPEHILEPTDIPVVHTDRGGQVTYHGPGQLMVYTLFNIKRHQMGIRQLVYALEQSVMDVLMSYQITSHRQAHAPGVYVNQAKICAIGLRIKQGCTYHGLALNIHMDLKPFRCINPCGYPNLRTAQLSDFVDVVHTDQVQKDMVASLMKQFRYTNYEYHAPFNETTRCR